MSVRRSVTPTPASLATLLDNRTLRRMAGPRSFARGEGYHAMGLVGSLVEDRGTISAKVRGTHTYRVTLGIADGDLDYSCTCPMGDDGEFCKHCVAVGLEWRERGGAEKVPGKEVPLKKVPLKKVPRRKPARPGVTMEDVRTYLARQTKGVLVDWLVEQALQDDRLRRYLLMKAATKGPKGIDVETWRLMIDNAVESDDFVDYREVYDYARGIDEVIDSLEALLKEGHAADVIDLTEHALGAVEEAINSVDDSGGHMSTLLERLQELHLAACKKARPDPEELARRLFAWEMRTDWDTFFGASQTYARILGPKGLAVYRALAEAEWATVPVLRPGREAERFGARFRITSIMETLARQARDIEAEVAIKKRDLTSDSCYLEIAEIYQKARKYDLALEWAELGLAAFPEHTDSRLREFLAREYHRRKRHDEAVALVWLTFAERPGLEQFQILKSHADRAGSWPEWRERALARLRKEPGRAERTGLPSPGPWSRTKDRSELVRIFLWEKDGETAWREAREGGCSDALWMELAATREKDHPEDALWVHQRQVPLTLNRKNKEAYREAIGLLRAIRGLLVRLGRGAEFEAYLQSVRAAHKPKRNFTKLLDHAKW